MAVVSKSINWNAAVWNQAVDAVAAMNGWTENITDGNGQTVPNPVSKDLFFKQQIKAWARNQAVEYANRQALASVVVEENN
jgi:hypothetical protein